MQQNLFNPLRVRAYLQTPIISDRFLPLDGIVFYHTVRDAYGPQVHTLPKQSTVKEFSGISLPFQKRNMNEEQWYYACSFAVWPSEERGSHSYARRFDIDEAGKYVDFGKKRGVVALDRGSFKNYFIKEYTFEVPYVDWYCRAKKEELELILPFCTHIGKKGAQGCGSVLSWEVESTDKDWYKNDDKGNVMRALPSNKGNAIYGIRPSYWLPKHQTKVILPD